MKYGAMVLTFFLGISASLTGDAISSSVYAAAILVMIYVEGAKRK